MDNSLLGDRMKEYESRNQYFLQRRTPVILRIDGKAFHTFTRGFQKPFDEVLGNAMVRTMEYLCQNISGCVFGFCQSDEITLVLQDYRKLNTDAWFGYRTDKLCSIAASMATMAFNQYFAEEIREWTRLHETVTEHCDLCYSEWDDEKNKELSHIYWKAYHKGAMFDARCFNIPKEEACNLVYWRQLDATRNSIQMVGQANFSHAELQGKSCNDIQDMLHEQRGINWNDFPTRWKRGVAWTKTNGTDYEMPILRGDDRKYVDDEVYFVEEE